MSLSPSFEQEPRRMSGLSTDERRIAEAVVAALEPRFASLEQVMDQRFRDHMTEIEDYYSDRDRQRDEELQQIRQDFQTILSKLE